MDDVTFWNDFYAMKIEGDSKLVHQQSTFADFVLPYLNEGGSGVTVVDLGCGLSWQTQSSPEQLSDLATCMGHQ